jgi:RimJ/RimL family protein N-acetyltransferase
VSAPRSPSRLPRVSSDAIALRPAVAADSQPVWKWRNDPDTRAASFDSAPIPWEQHHRWFSGALERDDRKVYIIEAEQHPAGVARLDIVRREAAVSIHLAPEWRGRGVGPTALRMLAERAFHELGLEHLLASVKADNLASLSAFARARFTETTRGEGVVTLERRRR